MRMLCGPPKAHCTFLGNDVGFGKTATALILVVIAYLEWKRRHGAGEPVEA